MTATPPDPDPDNTPGLEEGGGVAPGDTPPESGQTSGLSHRQPRPPKRLPVITIVLAVIATLLVCGLLAAQIAGLIKIW